MKFSPLGYMLLIENIPFEKKESGGIFIIDDGKPYYSKGRVIGYDKEAILEEFLGKLVVYPTDSIKILGLEFPKDYILVNIEDIHGIIEEGN